MRTFYDENHQQWKLHLTWDKAEQIAARCERPDSTPENRKTFDLFNLTNKEQIESLLLEDPYTGRFNVNNGRCLVNVMYVLCEEQCKEREMTDVQFGEMLMSSTFALARQAFMEELVNFIPDSERRTLFQNMLYLAAGNQSVALSEANRILAEKRTALNALTTQTIGDNMEKAMAPAIEAFTKAVGEFGTTNSSKSAEPSELHPAV